MRQIFFQSSSVTQIKNIMLAFVFVGTCLEKSVSADITDEYTCNKTKNWNQTIYNLIMCSVQKHWVDLVTHPHLAYSQILIFLKQVVCRNSGWVFCAVCED